MGESNNDGHSATRRFIRRWCSKLNDSDVDWAAASAPSPRYNCFGFAVGVLAWWQPPQVLDGVVQFPDHFWPSGVATDLSIDAYTRAAETQGFSVSPDSSWDEGFETIMLYFDEFNREFCHAARQKSSGVWESKLGMLSDIEHPIDGLDNPQYGQGRIYMKRPWPRAHS